jgi:type I restriction enzyme S subunit
MTKTTYKNSPLGLIPEDWEVKKFKEVAKFYSGGTPSTSVREYYEGDIPFIKSGEIYGEKTEQFLNEMALKNSSAKMVCKGDILYALYGANSGEVAVSKINGAINQAILCIKTELNNLFVFNFLIKEKDIIVKKYLQGGQGNLSADIVKKLDIPIPSSEEQTAIANCLSTWDKAIEKQQALIAQKELAKKALGHRLLTGKLRIKEFETESWIEIKADKIFRSNTDKTHNGELEILSASQERGILPRRLNNIDIKYDENSLGSYKKVEIGDYVISLRSFQGGIEYSEYEGIVSPAYTILKEIIPISKVFYKVYFKTETFINRLNTIIYGIRDGKQISFKDFATLKIPYPSIEEQTAIANVLQCADDELQLLKKKLEQLKEQKKGLMQVLLTGKKRLRIN